MMIEEGTGTYTGRIHQHNGYYAGDFSDVPFTWTPLYAPFTTQSLYPRSQEHR